MISSRCDDMRGDTCMVYQRTLFIHKLRMYDIFFVEGQYLYHRFYSASVNYNNFKHDNNG